MWSVEVVIKPAGNGLKKLLFRLLYYIGDVGEVPSTVVRGLQRFPDVIKGRVPMGGAPAALVGY